jgi:hypothetical protein
MRTIRQKQRTLTCDFLDWWKACKRQVVAVLLLGVIFAWMNVGLWQAERYSRTVVHEVRDGFHHMVEDRAMKTRQVLKAMEIHQAHQDRVSAAHREEVAKLRQMLAQFIAQPSKPAPR